MSKTSPTDPRVRTILDLRDKGMSQAAIGQAVGMSQQSVSRILGYLDTDPSYRRAVEAPLPGSLEAQIAAQRDRVAALDAHWRQYQGSCPPAKTFDDGSSLCVHEVELAAR
jgi:hypothetical protein